MKCPSFRQIILAATVIASGSSAGPAAEPVPNQTEGQAFLGGGYIGMAAECNFPTAPLERAMDALFDTAKVGPLEKARLQGVMMKGREIFHSVATTKGCAAVKQDTNNWFGPDNIRGFNQ
jgi:hypothetical protein